MAKVLRQFRGLTAPTIASYDALNLATGQGRKTFYGFKTASNSFQLSDLTPFPNSGDSTVGATMTTSESTILEVNFDLEFEIPQYVNGLLFVAATTQASGGGGTSDTGFLRIRILHVDTDSNETVIGAQDDTDTHTVPAITTNSFRDLIEFDINNVRFKKGETLRVEVLIRAYRTGTSSSDVFSFWIDPTNSFTTGGSNTPDNPSTFEVSVPFRIK